MRTAVLSIALCCLLALAAEAQEDSVRTIRSVPTDSPTLDGKLEAKPLLPRQWKKLTLTGIKWRGNSYDLVVEPEGSRLRKVSPAVTSRNAPKRSRSTSLGH